MEIDLSSLESFEHLSETRLYLFVQGIDHSSNHLGNSVGTGVLHAEGGLRCMKDALAVELFI
jgi:hypothetical protein